MHLIIFLIKSYLNNKSDNFFQGIVENVNKEDNLTKINIQNQSIKVFSKNFKLKKRFLLELVLQI